MDNSLFVMHVCRTVDYSSLTKYLMEKYQEFLKSDSEVLFVHIREPDEIEKFKQSTEDNCVTLLIRGRDSLKRDWNNAADDDVENYSYDFYYTNDKKLEEVEDDFILFFKQNIERCEIATNLKDTEAKHL